MSTRVVALGALYLDIVCTDFPYDEALWPEREVIGPGYRVVPGGSATNFACTSAALGLDAVLVGKSGADFPGETLRRMVAAEGVDLRCVVSETDQTNLGISFNGANGPIMTAAGSANQTMTPEEVLPIFAGVANGAAYAYFGGCLKLEALLPALVEVAAELRASGTKVIVDHGRVFNTLSDRSSQYVRDLCAHADLYLPSAGELMGLWGASTIEDAAREAQKVSDAVIVVKNGASGATCFDGAATFVEPGRSVRIISHVGAGDAFNAGLIRSHATGADLRQCMRSGVATAALKISTGHYPSASAVDTLLAN